MKFPAFHIVLWLFFYQQLSTCHGVSQLPSIEDNYSNGHGKLFFYYNQDDRVQVLKELQQVIRARYALLDIKRQRLGVDATWVFEQAVQREKAIFDVKDPLAQAAANLAFVDRIKQAAAKLEDTHLQVRELVELPEVYLGLQTRLIDGKVLVSGIERQLEEYWRQHEVSIEIGDEIVAIDGKPVADWLTGLEQYLPGSSMAYRLANAAEALSKRAFHYPTQAKVELTVKSAEDQELRSTVLTWYVNTKIGRPDAFYYLASLDINFRGELDYLGYSYQEAPPGMFQVKEWFWLDMPDQIAFRYGFIKGPEQKQIGVIQIYSFLALEVVTPGDEEILAWEEPLRDFLILLKDQNLPLILDLRRNEGGHTFLAGKLLQMLIPSGERYASYTEAFRMTPSVRQMWQGKEYGLSGYDSDSQAIRHVAIAASEGRDHTMVWAHSEPLEADEMVGGYSEPVVTLISPHCLSSCELLAIQLQKNTRSLLVGSATNGTGAGYFEWEPFSGGRWTDSYEIIAADIPNYLIGRPGEADVMLFEQDDAYLEFNQENRPVEADLQYRESEQDLMQGSAGWFAFAIQVLSRGSRDQTH